MMLQRFIVAFINHLNHITEQKTTVNEYSFAACFELIIINCLEIFGEV